MVLGQVTALSPTLGGHIGPPLHGIVRDTVPPLIIPITHLSYDSRNVKAGTLFFCKGAHFEPEYLAQAVKAGAVAYVSEQDYSEFLASAGLPEVPILLVREIRPAIADCAALFYRGLTEHLTIVGFTGTKGKSTATYMLRAILDNWLVQQGKAKSAWLSSIDNYDGVACTRSPLTTQDVLELYAHFKNTVDSGIEYLTMEVSSQALKYGRTRNVPFEVAGFLNIGDDHISDIEHPDHEDYLASKLKIFKQGRIAIINRESDIFERALKAAGSCEQILTYGQVEEADIVASNIESSPQGLRFDVVFDKGITGTAACVKKPSKPTSSCASRSDTATFGSAKRDSTGVAGSSRSFKQVLQHPATPDAQDDGFSHSLTGCISIPMVGRFNVENALAAISAAIALGVPMEHIEQGLAQAEVSGRMQIVAGPDDKLIIVDYAHNKMSFETIFTDMAHEFPNRPITCVFGATGTKATERRFEMAAVAVKYASSIYITEDDPGEEPLALINAQITKVIEDAGMTPHIIEDRDKAITHAIFDSPAKSLILILGKGHESIMRRGRELIEVPSDKDRVQTILNS